MYIMPMSRNRKQKSKKAEPPRTKKKSIKKPFQLSPALKFVLTFILSLVILGAIYSYFTARYHDQLGWVMETTASFSGWIASLFSSNVTYSERYITYNGFAVEIIDECTGMLEMVIYLAAVISFSTTIKKKLIGIAAGIPAIYVFNILRIYFLMVAGASSRKLFDFMHLYFWQATLIIMIASVWIGWLYLVVYREKKPVTVSS